MNVLIVDDHEIVRDGMALLLKDAFPIESILFAADGREAIQKATNFDVDLVLMDLSMPNGLDGFLALPEMRKLVPKGKIIVFSMYDEIAYQKKAFDLGADGFLVKNQKSDAIIKSIEQILHGKKVANEQVWGKKVEADAWETPFSPREQETFILTLKGYTQKDIAATMNISIRTVENHRRSISKKLGTTNKRDWLEYAQKHQMLEMY
ncbi:response regulator transcription factor [Bacillus marasmi]|uniref:response regulator transcription factor n=1 Tax=Bacillus marasmi TaxID=1926279 RepID=UPI0011CAC597|nr:response regulator transcription factor [Bacillus marasmi]